MLLTLITLGVGLPLMLSAATGSISIPHNDAWSHARIAQTFATSGRIELLGWNRSSLVGQIVVLGPLGRWIVAQHLFVALLAIVALLATYRYLLPRLGSAKAIVGTAAVAVIPEFGLLATSYMSDIPAFAAIMLCLTVSDTAIRGGRPGLLALSLAVGVWGVTIREQAIVAPVAVAVVAVLLWRGSARLLALAQAVVALAGVVAFESWRRSLPHGDSPAVSIDLGRTLRDTVPTLGYWSVPTLFTLGLYLFPLAAAVAHPRQWWWGARVTAGAATLLSLGQAYSTWRSLFLGNMVNRFGPYVEAGVGGGPVVIPDPVWFLVALSSCAGLGLVAGIVTDLVAQAPPWRPPATWDLTTVLVAGFLVAGTLLQAVWGQPIFSRYLIPLVALLCVALLRSGALSIGRAVGAALLLFGLSLLLTAHAFAYDAARWRAADGLVAAGVAPTDINAGFEWLGYHATTGVRWGQAHPEATGGFMPAFPESRECYVVAGAALPGRTPEAVIGYRTFALVGESRVWLYRQDPCR